jgi:hypothetical protein
MLAGAAVLLIARGLSYTLDCPILGPKWDSLTMRSGSVSEGLRPT